MRFSGGKRAEKTDEHRKQCLWQLVINKGQWKRQWIPILSQNRPPMHPLETVLHTTQRRSVHTVGLRGELLLSLPSMDYCADLNRLILLAHLGTATMEWTSTNDSWDLEFPYPIFSYYITLEGIYSLVVWLTPTWLSNSAPRVVTEDLWGVTKPGICYEYTNV